MSRIVVAEVVYDNPLDNVEVLASVLPVVKQADPSAANPDSSIRAFATGK